MVMDMQDFAKRSLDPPPVAHENKVTEEKPRVLTPRFYFLSKGREAQTGYRGHREYEDT